MNIGLKASLIRRAWSLNNEHYSGTTPCLDVHIWCLETGFFNLTGNLQWKIYIYLKKWN